MKASLNNYRQAPRKVRLITELIKGKSAAQAQGILSHLIKRGALPIKKLLDSAVANSGTPATELMIKKATVDKGVVIKRWMPRAMGRAFPIHKHTSKVQIELSAKPAVAKDKRETNPTSQVRSAGRESEVPLTPNA